MALPATYDYPTSVEIEQIEQKLLPKLTSNSPLYEFFPFDSRQENLLLWDQLDNYQGTQQYRGWNGQPPLVQRMKASRYMAEPGVYGEKIPLDERELTNRRAWGTLQGGPIPISDMVGEVLEQLLTRRLNLIELIGWNLLINGTFSVANQTGALSYGGSYTQQVFTPLVPWGTLATATPLQDLRQLRAFEAGQSVSFGTDAVMIGQWQTMNHLLNNTNPADLGGKRADYGATLNNIGATNQILVMNDIPKFIPYSGGYIDNNGTFQYFIPAGKLLVIGKRVTGRRMGYYRYTRNVNAPNAAAGPYTRVIDHSTRDVPALVEVHDGHNGGPVIQFPGSAVLMNVN